MQAVSVQEFGHPSSVGIEEVPDPSPGPGEVLIEVRATSVNFPDLMMIAGTYQKILDLPFTPGNEAAGHVVEVGAGVSQFRPNDRVLALVESGGYAEKLVASQNQVFALPEGVSYTKAAAFGLAYSTAWFGLVHRARLKSSHTVLITGAGGGVGSAGVDLAKAYGATVIALARDEERAALVRNLGADQVLVSTPDTLRDDLKEITDGRGVDITLESVGGDVLTQVIRSTAWEGSIVIVGFASGEQFSIKPGHLLVKNISVHGLQFSDYRDHNPGLLRSAMQEMLSMLQVGTLNPPVADTYSLNNIAAALDRFSKGKVQGKIVITTS